MPGCVLKSSAALIVRLCIGVRTQIRRELSKSHTNIDLFELGENVQFGEIDGLVAVDLRRILHQRNVKPTTPTYSTYETKSFERVVRLIQNMRTKAAS